MIHSACTHHHCTLRPVLILISRAGKTLVFKNGFRLYGFERFKKVFFVFFLYEDRTLKYGPKARGKTSHTRYAVSYYLTPVSEGEDYRVKNEDD